MNEIKILSGNALDLFEAVEDESVDLIIADPPYNLGKNYGNNLDSMGFDDYLIFSSNGFPVQKECYLQLVPYMYLWASGLFPTCITFWRTTWQ